MNECDGPIAQPLKKPKQVIIKPTGLRITMGWSEC